MKFSLSNIAALAAAVTVAEAHTIFQKVSVDGVEQKALFGIRAPDSNNPVQDVTSDAIACNTGITHKDNNIIDIPAGSKVGSWWQHVIGQNSPSDADNPIAASHHGPIQVYLAKVDDAASASATGQKWFKIYESGLSNGVWAIDTLIKNDGWVYFDMPSCVASGNYLMRVELLALHSATSPGGAQFYQECAQINVKGGGSSTGTDLVSFPGAYKSADPGITLSIYGSDGQPFMAGRSYTIPGPKVLQCPAGGSGGSAPATSAAASKPTSSAVSVKPVTTAKPATTAVSTTFSTVAKPVTTTAAASGGAGAARFAQCGGNGFTGPTTCAEGTCTKQNDYYSQCI